jgi:chitodextrinase
MKKSGRVDDPTANSGTLARRFEVSTESLAYGVVEPTPTFVSCDSDSSYANGDMLLFTSMTWEARYNGGHMAFKLWSTMDSTAKIANIIANAAGTAVTGSFAMNTSGVRTRQFRDNRSTAWEEIAQLLRTGDSLGRRLLASVTPQGTLVIEPEPAFVATTAYVWTRDGRLRDATGRYLLPGVLPAGQWVQIEALLTADWQADTTRFLVESAEYDSIDKQVLRAFRRGHSEKVSLRNFGRPVEEKYPAPSHQSLLRQENEETHKTKE